MTGYVTFGGKKANETVYRFNLERVPSELNGCFEYQQWMTVLYPIEVGKKTVVIALTTTESGLIWSFDCIELIAKYITYGK